MEGTYPLRLDGEQAGELHVSAQGGWTVFEAKCAARPGIVRISVYGEGREGYLGVLAPEGEGLALRRRLSRSELRTFPVQIEYAARAGEPVADSAPPLKPDDPGAPPEPEPETPPEPPPQPEPPSADADLYWYATPEGALVAFDGERNWVALPPEDPRAAAGGERRTIDGKEYVVVKA